MSYSEQDINDRIKDTVEFRRKVESSYLNKPDWSRGEVNDLIHLIGQYIIRVKLQGVAGVDNTIQSILPIETALFNDILRDSSPPSGIMMNNLLSQLIDALKAMEQVLKQMERRDGAVR